MYFDSCCFVTHFERGSLSVFHVKSVLCLIQSETEKRKPPHGKTKHLVLSQLGAHVAMDRKRAFLSQSNFIGSGYGMLAANQSLS